MPEAVPVPALKPPGRCAGGLVHPHMAGTVAVFGQSFLQGGSLDGARQRQLFHLQNVDDGGNTPARHLAPEQNGLLKQVFRNGGIVLLFPRLGGKPLEPFRAVLRQIPAQRPFRQTRLLHDLLTELPLLRGIQPSWKSGASLTRWVAISAALGVFHARSSSWWILT